VCVIGCCVGHSIGTCAALLNVDGLGYTLTRKRTKTIVINIRELSTLYPLSTHCDKIERVDFDCITSVYWALCYDSIVIQNIK